MDAMSFQSKLKEASENLAAIAKTRISDLDRKISELAQEKARLVDKRDSARTSVERGENYRAVNGLVPMPILLGNTQSNFSARHSLSPTMRRLIDAVAVNPNSR